jgi:hypothetical protein
MQTTYGEARANAKQKHYLPAVNDIRAQGAMLIDTINNIPFPPNDNVVEETEFFDLKRRAIDTVEVACLLAEKAANT